LSISVNYTQGQNKLPRGCLCRNARTHFFCSFWRAGRSCKGNTCDITPADTHLGTAHRTRCTSLLDNFPKTSVPAV